MTATDSKQLFKVLLSAAWIDGEVQPDERKHLQKKADELGLAGDPEVVALLESDRAIPAADCYAWLEAYLGSHPSTVDYQNLLEAVGATVYSDSDICTAEAELLGFLQTADPASQPSHNKLLQAIRSVSRKAFEALNN